MATQMKLDVRARVSAEEWEVRVDLAAAYRLVALFGWDDLIFTHISARVPGPEHHFLINPYGMLFDEITASSLVKIDLDGHKVMEVRTRSIRRASRSTAPSTPRARTRCACCTSTASTAWRCRRRRKACCRSRSNRSSCSPRSPITTTKASRCVTTRNPAWCVISVSKQFLMLRNHGLLTVGDKSPMRFSRCTCSRPRARSRCARRRAARSSIHVDQRIIDDFPAQTREVDSWARQPPAVAGAAAPARSSGFVLPELAQLCRVALLHFGCGGSEVSRIRRHAGSSDSVACQRLICGY